MALIALAGCASAPQKTRPAPAVVAAPAPASAATLQRPPAPRAKPPAAPTAAPATVWQRLRAGTAFTDCGTDAMRERWQRRYAGYAPRFAEHLREILPLLHYVLGEIEARGLPTEFALLPIVESWYVPVATHGNRPAGMWQLMPATARELGVRIASDYDGRLDPVASTRAALVLIERLQQRFDGRWPLVNMAYNAGEYRVLRALPREPAQQEIALATLRVPRTTHEHLAKLLALSCLVREPQRFSLELPAFDPATELAAMPLTAALDLELAAQLAGMRLGALRALNAGYHGPTALSGDALLLPRAASERLAQGLLALAPEQRTGWRRVALDAAAGWDDLVRGTTLTPAQLAAVNGLEPNQAPHGALLVPRAATLAGVRASEIRAPPAERHVVRSGDSLWLIARRYRVSIDALLQWNALARDALLRPGQKLWVVTPH